MTFLPLFAFSPTFPTLSLNYLRLTSFPEKAAILVTSDSSIQHQLANWTSKQSPPLTDTNTITD